MTRRLELNQILIELLGTRNVYFQPPATLKMKYPCIVYDRNDFDPIYADDNLYKGTMAYLVTVIDPNPDSEIPDKVRTLPLCRFVRHYTSDNLNHDVFNVYY